MLENGRHASLPLKVFHTESRGEGRAVTPQVLATGWIVSLDLIEQALVMIMSLDHNIGMLTSEWKPLLFEMRPNLIL
jgi:hypothetical protein